MLPRGIPACPGAGILGAGETCGFFIGSLFLSSFMLVAWGGKCKIYMFDYSRILDFIKFGVFIRLLLFDCLW